MTNQRRNTGKRKNSIVLKTLDEQNLADYIFADHPESHKALETFKYVFNVEVYPSENIDKMKIKGVCNEEIDKAKKGFSNLATRFAKGEKVDDVLIKMVAKHTGVKHDFASNTEEIIKNGRLKRERNTIKKDARNHPESHVNITEVEPRNKNQKMFLEDIERSDVTFGAGPAGTGKTFLAAYEAITALKSGKVEKIFLARPAVDADENLGALPGDEKAKLAPYLRPLYDELENLIGKPNLDLLQETGVIEIAPLGFMRGRTFRNAFVILDEAQNTTYEQMKMALTRIGEGSKMVVTGDPDQVDLPKGKPSGLSIVLKKLAGVEGVSIRNFNANDIVRSKVVSNIVKALDKEDTLSLGADNENNFRKTQAFKK